MSSWPRSSVGPAAGRAVYRSRLGAARDPPRTLAHLPAHALLDDQHAVSDRIGITSNFTLEDAEIDALLAQGVDAARDLRRFRFFTTAFATRSQGIDRSLTRTC